jgi:flagellar hook-basal body complex protein FliE
MTIPVSAAANAYTALSQVARDGGDANPAPTGDFAGILKATVDQVVEAGRASDQIAIQAVEGNANIVDVVTAVAESELALETMVSVRDRIISAYESILRMPI